MAGDPMQEVRRLAKQKLSIKISLIAYLVASMIIRYYMYYVDQFSSRISRSLFLPWVTVHLRITNNVLAPGTVTIVHG